MLPSGLDYKRTLRTELKCKNSVALIKPGSILLFPGEKILKRLVDLFSACAVSYLSEKENLAFLKDCGHQSNPAFPIHCHSVDTISRYSPHCLELTMEPQLTSH